MHCELNSIRCTLFRLQSLQNSFSLRPILCLHECVGNWIPMGSTWDSHVFLWLSIRQSMAPRVDTWSLFQHLFNYSTLLKITIWDTRNSDATCVLCVIPCCYMWLFAFIYIMSIVQTFTIHTDGSHVLLEPLWSLTYSSLSASWMHNPICNNDA